MPKARIVEVNVVREWFVAAINDDPGFAIVQRQDMLDKVSFILGLAFTLHSLHTLFRKWWTVPARGWACVGPHLIEQPLARG